MKTVGVDHSPPDDKLYGNPALGGGQIAGGSTSRRHRGSVSMQASDDEAGVVHARSRQSVDYGALVDDAAKLPVPADVKLEDPDTFRMIGTPARRVDVSDEPPGIPTAFWRGVSPTRNTYVVKSFIDELASTAKQDPVQCAATSPSTPQGRSPSRASERSSPFQRALPCSRMRFGQRGYGREAFVLNGNESHRKPK